MATNVDDLIAAAVRAQAAGRVDEAERLAAQVLRSNPDDIQALLLIGIAAVQKNDPGKAVPALERVMQLDPSSSDAPYWMSMILRAHRRLPQALAMAQRAVAANPHSEHAQNQLGMCHLDLNQRQGALDCFQLACHLAPKVAPFFDNLGRALQSLGRNAEAIAAYRQVLAIGPVRPGALFRLGDAYMMEPQVEAAAECARAILKMDPNSAAGTLLLARALIGAGKVEEGAKVAMRAIELAPGNAVPVAYYGRALQSLGRIEEADEQFRRSIELEPRQGFSYHSLVHNHKVTAAERPLVAKMKELAQEGSLPQREIIQLQYGLGKALEDLGEFESAMGHFDEANRIDHELKVGVAPFQKEQLAETADFLIRTFSEGFLKANQTAGTDTQLPIFVVGMMRSGTTLCEQILSSHPLVGGAGEQLFWPENAGSSHKLFRNGDPASFDATRLKALSSEYLDLLSSLAPTKERVVDKMNTNYLLLGLLHVAYPNARIVHMQRHPVDTCLSIWATPVANGIDLCASKENIVFAYEQYLRVMQHWRGVLPLDRFLDVQYEELVSDQERVTRQMIEFCGLDWDDACMKPEHNTRAVKTPSVWQVRQPVYKTSMRRWRKYEPWLGAFSKLL